MEELALPARQEGEEVAMTQNGSARQDGFLEHARERLEGVFRHEHRKDADMTDHSLSQDGRPGQGVNVVLVHGAWADGSSWSRVIQLLEDAGYGVTAAQIPLTALADDVAVTRRVLAMQNGPTVLVGHSVGGAVISAAGTDAPNVVSLVYVAAFAPDEGETLEGLTKRFPPVPGLAQLRPDKGASCGSTGQGSGRPSRRTWIRGRRALWPRCRNPSRQRTWAPGLHAPPGMRCRRGSWSPRTIA
jgi:pimeloyl-ACP methyl ester carboxylesterase